MALAYLPRMPSTRASGIDTMSRRRSLLAAAPSIPTASAFRRATSKGWCSTVCAPSSRLVRRSVTPSRRSALTPRPNEPSRSIGKAGGALDQACITRASRTRAILGPADPDWRGPNLGVAPSNRNRVERNARRASQAKRMHARCRTFRPVDHRKPSPGWKGGTAGDRQWRRESDRRRPCLPDRPSDGNAQHVPCGP